MASDRVDEAIAAIAPAPAAAAEQTPVATFNFRFKSGREARLFIDSRATEADLLELIGTLGMHVPAKLVEFRTPGHGLVLARGRVPRA